MTVWSLVVLFSCISFCAEGKLVDDAVGLWMHFILNQLDKLNKLSTSLNSLPVHLQHSYSWVTEMMHFLRHLKNNLSHPGPDLHKTSSNLQHPPIPSRFHSVGIWNLLYFIPYTVKDFCFCSTVLWFLSVYGWYNMSAFLPSLVMTILRMDSLLMYKPAYIQINRSDSDSWFLWIWNLYIQTVC